MTREDYRVIAEALKQAFALRSCDRDCVYLVCDTLKRNYTNFNQDKFLEEVFQHKPARC